MRTSESVLAARGESPARHRDPSKVKPEAAVGPARREEGEHREYSTHRGQRPAPPKPGCIGGRIPRDFHHGLLGGRAGRLVAIPLLVGVLTAACGYSLAGRGSFLPEYIETIGIPLFMNNTSFFEVEQLLTQSVRSEFIGRGNYQVVPDATGVDAVLEGRIVSIRLRPSSFTDQQQASRYTFTLTARIIMRDLQADEIIWENQALIFTEEYDVATGGGALNASAFFGQDTNALERMAREFATTVVSSILEAF